MHVPHDIAKKLKVIQNHWRVFGCWATIREVLVYMIKPHYDASNFDELYGTDTSTLVMAEEGQITDTALVDAIYYQPTADAVVKNILSQLNINYSEYTFVDIGCGKGRVLLTAAAYPFQKIVGIELSPVTSKIAVNNIEIFKRKALDTQKCRNIEVRCENATDFDIPDSNLVVFLFNPFVGRVFRSCLTHLHRFASVNCHRKVIIVYVNPWSCTNWMEKSGLFEKVHEVKVIQPTWSWNIWKPIY
jgi:SAM-dependent methyltransferase